MSTETLRAHCGACAGLMILVTTPEGISFLCLDCGERTDPRPSADEAAEDVVWVPAKRKPEGRRRKAE